jgi:hypothetical protein
LLGSFLVLKVERGRSSICGERENIMKNILAIAFVAVGAVAQAQNTGALLTSNGSIYNLGSSSLTATGTLPTSSTSGNPSSNFVVGSGTLRNAFSGFWYYRIAGDTRERTFNSATSRTLTGTNEVNYGYTNLQSIAAVPTATANMQYQLFGALDGQSAYLFSRMTIANSGASDLNIDLFWANDMDLAGTFPGDVVAPLEDVAGVRKTWNVSDSGWNMKYTGFGAAGAGVGGFSAINGQMTDTSIDNFIPDLNAGGLAAGDQAQVMQWRFTIAAGSSKTATGAIAIGRPGANITAVPEPATMTVLGLGLAALARRRKNA